MRRNKYGVAPKEERTSRDGILFDSKGELKRWENLRLWQLKGDIRNLRRQVEYPLVINGETVGTYTPDFVYEKKVVLSDNDVLGGLRFIKVVEDFKGKMTRDAALRIKVFEAIYGEKVLITK